MAVPNPLEVLAAQKQEEESKRQLEEAKADRERGVKMAQMQDWSPERVRDQVGTYQRSRSPVADAYLQSVLTGDNPAAIQGTRLGANIDKHDAQKRFDSGYGGWDSLRAQQRQMDNTTPWAVPNPTGKQYGDDKDAAKLSREELRDLEQLGGVKVSTGGDFIGTAEGKAWGMKPFHALGYTLDGKGTRYAGGDPKYLERIRRYLAELKNGGGSGSLGDLQTASKGSAYETYDNDEEA